MCKCMWVVPLKLTLSQITVYIFMFQELLSFAVCKFNRYCLWLTSPMLFIFVRCESLYENLKGHACMSTDFTTLKPNCFMPLVFTSWHWKHVFTQIMPIHFNNYDWKSDISLKEEMFICNTTEMSPCYLWQYFYFQLTYSSALNCFKSCGVFVRAQLQFVAVCFWLQMRMVWQFVH